MGMSGSLADMAWSWTSSALLRLRLSCSCASGTSTGPIAGCGAGRGPKSSQLSPSTIEVSFREDPHWGIGPCAEVQKRARIFRELGGLGEIDEPVSVHAASHLLNEHEQLYSREHIVRFARVCGSRPVLTAWV